MGLLDELKQQADHIRANEETDEDRQRKLAAHYQDHMRPKVISIADYLFEMGKQLKVVKLEVPVIYHLPVVAAQEFLQGLYTINLDHQQQPRKIGISFDCQTRESSVYPVHSREDADTFRAFLDKQRVQYTEWAIRDADNKVCGANFEGVLKVQVRMLLQVDPERDRFDLFVTNFEALGTKKLSFSTDQITDEWLDDLGHYLLRKDRRLAELEIGDHHREIIKTNLTNWEEERRQELEAAETEESAADKEKLFAGLRKSLNKPLW